MKYGQNVWGGGKIVLEYKGGNLYDFGHIKKF